MDGISFDDLDEDNFFSNMTGDDRGHIGKIDYEESLSSDGNSNAALPKFKVGGSDSAGSSTSKDHQPVVFKIRGHYENMNLDGFGGKTNTFESRRDVSSNSTMQKNGTVSQENVIESSEESIPSEDEGSDEDVEIIGEKPGSGGGVEGGELMGALAEERPPSDEDEEEESDSEEEEDWVEEVSSEETGDGDSEDEEEEEEEEEEEDGGEAESEVEQVSVHDTSTSDTEQAPAQQGEEQKDRVTQHKDSTVSQSRTKVGQGDKNMSNNDKIVLGQSDETVHQQSNTVNQRQCVESTEKAINQMKTVEVDSTSILDSSLEDFKVPTEDSNIMSEITFSDLQAAEEYKNTVPNITFSELKSDDQDNAESSDANLEAKEEGAVSSTVQKKGKKKDEAEDQNNGKKKRKRKREKDPNKKASEKKKGTKRRKKEKPADDSPKKRKKTFERKNIRKIIKDQDLDEETVRAQQEEMERKQRMQEKMERLKQSQLQSLLEDDDDLPENDEESSKLQEEILNQKVEDAEVVEISSDEEDIHMVPVEPEGRGEEHDPNNSGSHVNDDMNQPDAEGRVLVNVGHPPSEPDVFLAPLLAANVKPHQIGGIRFLYDNLVESLQQYKTTNGFGCILAHSMGLGKTLQVISFVDVFLRFTEGQRVLIIVPVNTLQNWMNEFNMWLPPEEKAKPDDGIWPRQFKVYMISDSQKNNLSRLKVVEDWFKLGGCLLMGYEMYRLLTSKKVALSRPKRSRGSEPVLIDLVEEEKNTELMISLKTALVNPGPDLIICDEGHRIKNSCAGISQSLKNIKTRRRVVLTGYPLQNNLQEYWCMVDFTRPNFLGTKTEFANMFERPIMNGQCVDSTSQDQRLMRFRAHVLHSLLEGFVQRRSHDVLRRALPPKEEHVILVKMSSVQRSLYKAFMESLEQTDMGEMASANPLKAFSVCCKIWNHPDILNQIVEQRRMEDNDLDIDEAKMDGEGGSSSSKPSSRRGKGKSSASDFKKSASNPELTMPYLNDKQTTISYDWAHEHLKGYQPGVIDNSGKLVILLSILEKSLEIGDKVLVFSQSLFTLTLIEDYLNKLKLPNRDEYWAKNKNYFRLDGSTVSQDREKLISQFNAPDNNSVHLFLLSTRAGCLGINLIGANRVVVFDASWNPCHDCQAVCRVYRYGQMKNCFVYRLVSDLTMEKKIYDRQISKQGMSNRVVDELNPISSLTRRQVDVLLQYEDADPKTIDKSLADEKQVEDLVLYRLIKQYNHWITKLPFSHESLLIDRKDQRLTTTEKKLAHQGYEMEKKMSNSYNRPSYTAFYPRAGPTVRPNIIRRPIASVRPMMQPPVMTTPIPMQPRTGQRHTLVGEVSRPPGPKIIGPGASKISTAPPALLKPGVSVQQIKLKSDIPIPNSTAPDGSLQRIPAGENVLVIKTPKGVYIRTPGGKIFAVRSAPKEAETSESSMQDIITKSVAAASKIQEETATGSKPATITVTVPVQSSTKAGDPKGAAGQKVISITPKISIVKSTVQKLKADSSSGTSPHVISVTNSGQSGAKGGPTLNISVLKPNSKKDSTTKPAGPRQSLLKTAAATATKETPSSDEDISVVSLKKGRKQRQADKAKERQLAEEEEGEEEREGEKSASQKVSSVSQESVSSSQPSPPHKPSQTGPDTPLQPLLTNQTPSHQDQQASHKSHHHKASAASSQSNDSLFHKSDYFPIDSQKSDSSTASKVSEKSTKTQASQRHKNAVSKKPDNVTVSQKSDNVSMSQRFDTPSMSRNYDYPALSQNFDNSPVTMQCDSPSAPPNFDHLRIPEKYDSPPVHDKYEYPTGPQKITDHQISSGQKPVKFEPHSLGENSPASRKYSQSVPQSTSQHFDSAQVSQTFSKPSASQQTAGVDVPQKYNPNPGQNMDNPQMNQKYSSSTSNQGGPGFPFYAPSFSGPSQYMPWLGPAEHYGYPQYGWGMGHPMQHPHQTGLPSALGGDMPAMPPTMGGSFPPPPYPANPYQADPYYMGAVNPAMQGSGGRGGAPNYSTPDLHPQGAAPAPTYGNTDTPSSTDNNSLDNLVKDLDIDLTTMTSADHFNL